MCFEYTRSSRSSRSRIPLNTLFTSLRLPRSQAIHSTSASSPASCLIFWIASSPCSSLRLIIMTRAFWIANARLISNLTPDQMELHSKDAFGHWINQLTRYQARHRSRRRLGHWDHASLLSDLRLGGVRTAWWEDIMTPFSCRNIWVGVSGEVQTDEKRLTILKNTALKLWQNIGRNSPFVNQGYVAINSRPHHDLICIEIAIKNGVIIWLVHKCRSNLLIEAKIGQSDAIRFASKLCPCCVSTFYMERSITPIKISKIIP